jgi:hypothetical protein
VIVDLRGISVIVSDDRSRTVTTALPPRSIRAIARSPVTTRSFTNTSSLNFSGRGWGAPTPVTVTLPSSVVTTPAFDAWAKAPDGARVRRRARATTERQNPSNMVLS